MGCVAFWLDNPVKALENIKTIIPRPGQCIDEKLNGLSLFVVLFTVFLAAAKVKYYWVFGAIGLAIIIAIKLIWFSGRKGKSSIEEYMSGEIDYDDLDSYVDKSEISESLVLTEDYDTDEYYEPIYEDDLKLQPWLDNNGDSWEEIKGRVGDQIAYSRFPSMTYGCTETDNCYF